MITGQESSSPYVGFSHKKNVVDTGVDLCEEQTLGLGIDMGDMGTGVGIGLKSNTTDSRRLDHNLSQLNPIQNLSNSYLHDPFHENKNANEYRNGNESGNVNRNINENVNGNGLGLGLGLGNENINRKGVGNDDCEVNMNVNEMGVRGNDISQVHQPLSSSGFEHRSQTGFRSRSHSRPASSDDPDGGRTTRAYTNIPKGPESDSVGNNDDDDIDSDDNDDDNDDDIDDDDDDIDNDDDIDDDDDDIDDKYFMANAATGGV